MLETVQSLLASVIDYVSKLNLDEVIAAVRLVIGNLNVETFQQTFDALKEILTTISGIFG